MAIEAQHKASLVTMFGQAWADAFERHTDRYEEIKYLYPELFAEAKVTFGRTQKWFDQVAPQEGLADSDYIMLANEGPAVFGGRVTRGYHFLTVIIHTD